MTSSSQYQDLSEFLAKHSAKNHADQIVTHTRIPDTELKIYPGAYVIPSNTLPTLYSLLFEHIFVQKKKEYLTEKQNGLTLAVDFDFRYKYDIDTRQHTKKHIKDMILLYLEEIKGFYLFEVNKPFDIFIFEKPHVNRLEDGSLTKDGIHMIIGIQMEHILQLILRDKIIEKLPEEWDLPLENTWDSVLDKGISMGHTNWQLFGCRKPQNEAYELVQHFVVSYDATDSEFMVDEKKVSKFDLKNNYGKLSVQYEGNPKFEMNPKIIDAYNKCLENKDKKIKKPSSKTKINLLVEEDENDPDEEFIALNDIKDAETLEKAISIKLKKIKPTEYDIRETHEYTQVLPEKYYEPGSHLLNRMVAFALKNTDDRLFLSWVQLRSKAQDFDYDSIPSLYDEWKKFHRTNQSNDRVTKRSIMYWAKQDNYEGYETVKKNTIQFYINESINSQTEYDLAQVLKQMYKDKYICVSYDKKGVWYVFKNHRWVIDKGHSLREKISKTMFDLYSNKRDECTIERQHYDAEDPRAEFLKKQIASISCIMLKLKKTTDKNNIMREAAEIFYDGEFIKNMDTNKYLMCFNNGVVDFKNKIFRDGYPEDYITKSTKIDYVHYDDNKEDTEFITVVGEIKKFMNKLFPITDLNQYMFDHFASCLIGANKNQTFNVYHGSGSNGKSIVADLMSVTLGEYKGTVPITLVTDVRGKIGGTSDEVLKLKGIRYAVMQEPSKGVKLNEGIMKELTGGDPIQARGLYSESEIFEPQFTLVVCTNNLFDIESNDDGTWRRIRKCDFVSKFVDEGETYNDDAPYIFLKDKSLKEKLPSLAPIFASMLVKRAFETDGIVENCETVANASNKYRRGQDHISAYISDKIMKTSNNKDKIGKRGLQKDFTDWFEITQGSKKGAPKGEELFEIMTKKFGQCKQDGWHFVKFIEPEEDEDDIINHVESNKFKR
jgi:P4 family phage/plasmid primase-like protien